VAASSLMNRGRPFRPKSSSAKALRELASEAGSQFDARVVGALGQLLGDAKGHTPL
jgi:HD-GYP domain-containing protein (c-di-GMP phosphodiesterase class II)